MLNWRQKRGSAVPTDTGDHSLHQVLQHRHHDAFIQMSVYTRLYDVYKCMYSSDSTPNPFGRWVGVVEWMPVKK